MDVIYTDFEKAYEKIDHLKLLEKCKSMGIEGKIGKWLQKFLENRTQQVLIEGTKSEISNVVSGSVQGSVLGPVLFLIYITDISKEVKSDIKLFVDDAKLKIEVKTEENIEELQNDLEKLYEWQTENKMKFNGTKFQALRYGPNEEIKNNTLYFTQNMEEIIPRMSSVRDLGVIMSDTGTFEEHIQKVSKVVRQKIGWILRTFYCRRTEFLKHLWKTLVQVHIDYCSQLYMPSQGHDMMSIEKLCYDFTTKIPGVRDENYWTRLKLLQLYSQERRMERYRIIYVWKIIEKIVPNPGIEVATDSENNRLGRRCKIPQLKSNGRQAIKTLRENSFLIHGVKLFNCIPNEIRNIKNNQDKFKLNLDKFLSGLPDHPKIGSLVPAALDQVTVKHSNSILAWSHEL